MTQDSYREDGVASNWGEVGRFGKFDQPPKKKKKKNKPKVDPPKPKLKIPSIG